MIATIEPSPMRQLAGAIEAVLSFGGTGDFWNWIAAARHLDLLQEAAECEEVIRQERFRQHL